MAGKLFHHPFEQYLDLVVWRCVKIAPEQKINKKYEAPTPIADLGRDSPICKNNS
jgi:hypothetical protein